jgi:hypothetical protein
LSVLDKACTQEQQGSCTPPSSIAGSQMLAGS